jgi:hypothetical protein
LARDKGSQEEHANFPALHAPDNSCRHEQGTARTGAAATHRRLAGAWGLRAGDVVAAVAVYVAVVAVVAEVVGAEVVVFVPVANVHVDGMSFVPCPLGKSEEDKVVVVFVGHRRPLRPRRLRQR